MRIIGIDENGLGPLLGPMIVTGVAFDAEDYDREAFWQAAGPELPADDSKVVFSSRRLGSAEFATLKWLVTLGVRPRSHQAVIEQIGLDVPFSLHCDGSVPLPCAPLTNPLPRFSTQPLPCSERYGAALHAAGVTPVAARAVVICPGLFNQLTEPTAMNKLRLDFELMCRLFDDLRDTSRTDTLALCGKIGSTRSYGKWYAAAERPGWAAQREERAESIYRHSECGTMSFIRDADAAHLPVAVASMIGKYLRELAMVELNRALDPQGRPVSGYRDRLTADFVTRTAARREELGLAANCFLRNS